MIKQALLFFHTVKFLKWRQIYYRVRYSVVPYTTKFAFNYVGFCRPTKNFVSIALRRQTWYGGLDFGFFGRVYRFDRIGWYENSLKDQSYLPSKLWRYNQHYFDFLNSNPPARDDGSVKRVIYSWINENRVGFDVGWEPYPCSIRIVNWVKWALRQQDIDIQVLKSLGIQVAWLETRIEYHLLANHLLANAKALIFGGVYLNCSLSERWINLGMELLSEQLDEQILNDGGHFELSPMYHSIILEDLLDLFNLFQCYNHRSVFPIRIVNKIKQSIMLMMSWLRLMTHPDGGISYFNDSVRGVSAEPYLIYGYARALGFECSDSTSLETVCLKESGYVVSRRKSVYLVADVGEIGPKYQPGHAHADTLSFELSVFDTRLFVNLGISDYALGEIRHRERCTRSHNTVALGDENSSQVWAAFRVANRAVPQNLQVEDQDDKIVIKCSHDGYSRFLRKQLHQRIWVLQDGQLFIKDSITSHTAGAFAYFHLGPSATIVSAERSVVKIRVNDVNIVTMVVELGELECCTPSDYCAEFGRTVPVQTLRVKLIGGKSSVNVLWG